MFITDANTPQDDEEPWMALPLFNRKGSPDHTQGVLTWFSSWPPPPESDDIVPLPGYDHLDHHDHHGHHDHHNHHNHFDDSPPATSSTRSSRPQSVSLASESCYYDSSHSNGTSLSNGTNNNTNQPVIDSYFPGDDEDGNDSNGFGRQQAGLLDEISDEHIPQPSFTPCSACPYPDCKSDAVFTTGRDFRRHYRQHFKRFFCRYAGCPQSARDAAEAGVGNKGFATRKDRTRHEAKHNPAIQCKWRSPSGEQCSRTFSRMDNMRDHYRRIHNK